MPFLQSLFCWVGSDNRIRFSFIITVSHLFFIFFSVIFASSTLISVIALLLASAVITCTTKRRLTDAKLTHQWLIAPIMAFIFTGLLIIMINGAAIYWLSLVSLAVASILLTYPSKNRLKYHYGYAGPIDLTANRTVRSDRIEPTLQASTAHLAIDTRQHHYTTNAQNTTQLDIGEQIREKLLSNKNALTTVIILVALVVSAMLFTTLLSTPNNTVESNNQPQKEAKPTLVRENELLLPDDFTLFTSLYGGLIINWQADNTAKTTLWDIRQAKGDKSCRQIEFNNGESTRTTSVEVEHQENYFAQFSPLDTQILIKNIAAKNNFSLCGYTFSLKGSQAVLGKHPYYAEILAN